VDSWILKVAQKRYKYPSNPSMSRKCGLLSKHNKHTHFTEKNLLNIDSFRLVYKTRPYGTPKQPLLLLFFSPPAQHKAAGRKTRLDIQNYGCNGNLLCHHGVVERNRISSLQSH